MAQLVLMPIIGNVGQSISIELEEWSLRLGEGGFGQAFENPNSPGFVLKQMDSSVAYVDALPEMRSLSKHAKVMGQRLSDLIGSPETSPFVRAVCQNLSLTLTTHIGYCAQQQKIYLYQRRASGISLEDALRLEPPPWRHRVRIAKNFASVMAALRRCYVVHLDPRPVNVFVNLDPSSLQVALIDLDGCGVLHSSGSEQSLDSWHIPPSTMGKAEDMAKPLWFPKDPHWQGPLSGNFKFAERWCVLNETWKILSWGMTALGWLDHSHDDLLNAADLVQEMFNSGSPHLISDQHAKYLSQCQRAIASKMRPILQNAETHTMSLKWEEYNLGEGSRDEEKFITDLALMTLWSFVDPKDERLPPTPLRPDSHEMPSAQWVQNALFNHYG